MRKIQIKSPMRYNYTSIIIVKKNNDDIKLWQRRGETGSLTHWWYECKMIQPLWKTLWRFLKKLNIQLPYNPATVLLSIYPREIKNYVHTTTCTHMFIAALFIIVLNWKQPRCPLIGRWLNKVVHGQYRILLSNKKKWSIDTHNNLD